MPKHLESMTSKNICAYLDTDLALRLRAQARDTGHSLSSIVNDALKLYFARLDLIERIDHTALLRDE